MPVDVARRPLLPTILLCVALALALFSPATASARASDRSSAAKLAERAQRQALRAQLRSERTAAREATRSERQRERAERLAVRRAERSKGDPAPHGEGNSPEPTSGPEGAEGQPQTPVTAGETPPSSTVATGCSITVATSSGQVTAGESVTLSGKLSCPGDVGVEGRQVTISQREAGASSETSSASAASTPVASATTGAEGCYQFRTASLTGRSTFIARSSGARRGARVVVRVNAGLTFAGSAASGASLTTGASKAAGGSHRVSFSGIVQPASAGTGVGLRVRYAGQQWRTVAFAHTDDAGHYSFSHRFAYAGEVEVVAVAHPHGEQRTESAPLSYTIVQAQNPALTIQVSQLAPAMPAAPVLGSTTPSGATPSGATTTISGVAANSPNKTVTLLARTSAGRFAPVATVSADGVGGYSFSVAPTQTTVYEVTCARSRSTPIRVAVG
jgi:hypothetical protein